jgi:AcrR family transcriptional regulator
MARKRPATRLSALAAAAVETFIRFGYSGAQMDEVARALGVAKGTLYLYVESKEALFDLAIRFVAGDPVDSLQDELPLPSPAEGRTFRRVEEELGRRAQLPRLLAAVATSEVTDVRAEARAILEELFDVIHDNRVGLKMLDRCAREMADISTLWYRQSREGVRGGLHTWLIARRAHLRPLDPAVSAWFIMEAVAFWAMHRHWDPAPPVVADATARAEIVTTLLRTLVPDPV